MDYECKCSERGTDNTTSHSRKRKWRAVLDGGWYTPLETYPCDNHVDNYRRGGFVVTKINGGGQGAMILKLEDGTEAELRFTHDQAIRCTQVAVTYKGINTVGTALCHKKEPFNKSIGRKVALARAMKYILRAKRTKIWKEYWEFVNDSGKKFKS